MIATVAAGRARRTAHASGGNALAEIGRRSDVNRVVTRHQLIAANQRAETKVTYPPAPVINRRNSS